VRCLLLLSLAAHVALAQSELRFFIRSDPKTLNPFLVEDDASETVRYLTAGVLVRLNRVTQKVEPELATAWKQSPDGRSLTLRLRENVRFSDGSPFTAADVVHTFRVLMDPAARNATADSFRTADQPPDVRQTGPLEVSIRFPAPVASALRLLDQVPIVSARSGPYQLAEYRRGAYILLKRNPHYWKRDSSGAQLPRIEALRMRIQPNRELEALAFRRGEVDLISRIDGAVYADLEKQMPGTVHDLGASNDSEFVWFNQVPTARIPDHRKEWFSSSGFRRAVSAAIQRADLARIVYKGHALPSVGPFPPTNRTWYNRDLKAHSESAEEVRKRFAAAGFTQSGGVLKDRRGNAVTFSILTNSGNRAREQLAALIQRDLKVYGIEMNIVTLDFPALLERIGKTFEYEACLLGLVNVDADPNGQMNVWLSSGANHQWNPRQAKPATSWEEELDKAMLAQAAATSEKKRQEFYNRVQTIIREQEPFVYLVHPSVLVAYTPELKNVQPATLRPHLLWNVEHLALAPKGSR
jgi:peptide/nickel transport system substrate-binding protein